MKYYVVLILFLLSFTLLFSENSPKVKSSINLGLANGASIGLGMDKINNPKRDYFVNAVFCTNDFLWYAGINHETRYVKGKNFYILMNLGIDYVVIPDWNGDPGGSHPDDPPYSPSFLFPHITTGIGYQVALSRNSHLFIEWDIGIKASISKINLGLSL